MEHRILLLGSGGREHALAWKMAQSPMCSALWVAPGNAGTALVAENVKIDPMDFEAVGKFCVDHDVTMMVVGPEGPLVAGIVDHFNEDEELWHIMCLGPSKEGAQLEGSKAFAKTFMKEFDIPTAGYREFTAESLDEGIAYLKSHATPIVLKADGLAAGKGVVICASQEQAIAEFKEMLSGKFGAASARVVVEEFLDGMEFSVFALTDGWAAQLLPVAKDYKRIGEGDTGLNTGGMGSVSPVPFVDQELMKKVVDRIIIPTISGISGREMDYRGFVFFGLISVGGEPYVIEYNCRMGDPETQVVIPRLHCDLVAMFDALHNGTLANFEMDGDRRFATTIVSVSGGYPEAYEKGKSIILPDQTPNNVIVFHAGTSEVDGALVTNGGRVIAATALAESMEEALRTCIETTESIQFEGKYFRKDIGFDL